MRKWMIGCIGVVLVVLGLLAWGFTQLGVRAPWVRIVHIETPGGPVPIKVVFFDGDSAIIEVGNGDRHTKQPLISGRDRDFRIQKFDWSSSNFEIEFPREQTVLVLNQIADGQDETRVEGALVVRDGDEIVEEFKAEMPRVMRLNWFDPAASSDEEKPLSGFGGRWSLESQTSQGSAMIEIIVNRSVKDNTIDPDVGAVLLSFATEHRNFAGCISGSRIRLASFDNAYPALIDATIQEDGTLKGDLWVGDRLHESFTATKQ